jgi:hypothetical protein
MTTATTVLDLGNNESLVRGLFANADGTWTAVTFCASRTFKTRAGASRWLALKVAR